MAKLFKKPAGTLLFTIVLLTGCVSVPDAIKGQSPMPQQDLLRVMNAPQLYIGQESRFGGRVVKVNNLNNMTRIEIATQPLDSGARPELGAASGGRIYADVKGFVDPEDLRNQYITVLGTIKGSERGAIGKASYNFIVIDVRGYQRWHQSQQIMLPAQPIDPWIWYGHGPYHHRYWGPGPWGYYYNPGPAQVQTFLTE